MACLLLLCWFEVFTYLWNLRDFMLEGLGFNLNPEGVDCLPQVLPHMPNLWMHRQCLQVMMTLHWKPLTAAFFFSPWSADVSEWFNAHLKTQSRTPLLQW